MYDVLSGEVAFKVIKGDQAYKQSLTASFCIHNRGIYLKKLNHIIAEFSFLCKEVIVEKNNHNIVSLNCKEFYMGFVKNPDGTLCEQTLEINFKKQKSPQFKEKVEIVLKKIEAQYCLNLIYQLMKLASKNVDLVGDETLDQTEFTEYTCESNADTIVNEESPKPTVHPIIDCPPKKELEKKSDLLSKIILQKSQENNGDGCSQNKFSAKKAEMLSNLMLQKSLEEYFKSKMEQAKKEGLKVNNQSKDKSKFEPKTAKRTPSQHFLIAQEKIRIFMETTERSKPQEELVSGIMFVI